MIFLDNIERCPYFVKTAEFLEEKSPLFKKSFHRIRTLGPDYEWAETMCRNAFVLSDENWDTYLVRVATLISFSFEFLRLQIELEKTGAYRYKSFKEVEDEIYNNPENQSMGAPYIWALYFSQVFWESHHEIFKFFHSNFATTHLSHGRILEIPLGTGVLSTDFLLQNPKWKGIGIDLSETAIDFTHHLLQVNAVRGQMELIKKDINAYNIPAQKFDRIICGEFLEHVEDPLSILKQLHRLLAEDGTLFLSVAVYAAAIDHIYLYKNAEEVRTHIREAGFIAKTECIQNIASEGKPEQSKTPLNYCAILTKNLNEKTRN